MDKPRVVLIDLSSLFWAAWHVHNENGAQEARSATLAGVKRAMADASDLVAICCDSGKSFRKEISAEYKAQREKQPEAAYGELNKTKDRLRADGFLLWEAPTFEADDIIATACDKACAAGHEVRIASADKDLLQLVGTGRDVLRVHTWEVWNAAKVEEKFKIKPTQMGDFLALKGDTSDNVPGCQGIGDVRAAQLLAKYGNLDKLYAAIDAGEAVATPANLKALTEQRAAVMLSRKLVELRFDVPLNFDDIYAERKVTPLTQSEPLPEDGDPTDDSRPDAETAAEADEKPTTPALITSAESSKPTSETAALAVAPVFVEYERQLEPRSLRAAVWLGQHLFDSRLYQKFGTPEAITAVIIRGRELGLGATTALDIFHVIDGKPVPYAWFVISLATESKACEFFELVDANDKAATWKTKRRGNTEEKACTFTYEQAERARLPKEGSRGPNAWLKTPEDMLVKTAGVKLARRVYPAQTLGLYCMEEMGGDE